jgi:hypothetical protein
MKAFVDPQTFQIIRLEYTVQDVDVDSTRPANTMVDGTG